MMGYSCVIISINTAAYLHQGCVNIITRRLQWIELAPLRLLYTHIQAYLMAIPV